MNLDEFLTTLENVRRDDPSGFWVIFRRYGSSEPLYWLNSDRSRICALITAVYNAVHGTTHGMLPPERELPLATELGLLPEVAIQIMGAAQGLQARPFSRDQRDHHGYDEQLRRRLIQILRPEESYPT